MEFIYADDLKSTFNVKGCFYELDINNTIFKCRNRLDITSEFYNGSDKADIIVVMMNPGSSKPKNKNHVEPRYSFNELDKLITPDLIETIPDNTQYQIMRLMVENNWDYAVILNLSDLRNGNSSEFSKLFDIMSIADYSHPDSIFSDLRKNEIDTILSNCKTNNVLVGWGSLLNQQEFMKKAIKKFVNHNLIGIKSNKCEYCYAHPSPQQKTQKVAWLESISMLIKT